MRLAARRGGPETMTVTAACSPGGSEKQAIRQDGTKQSETLAVDVYNTDVA